MRDTSLAQLPASQNAHVPEPAAAYVPASQFVQVNAAVAPDAVEYVAAGQFTHAVTASDVHVPGRQVVHVDAATVEYEPASQLMHESKVAPTHVEYEPAPQLLQDAAPFDNPCVPGSHIVHVAAPLVEYVPASHDVHCSLLVAPFAVEYVPGSQSPHTRALDCEGGVIVYRPALQISGDRSQEMTPSTMVW